MSVVRSIIRPTVNCVTAPHSVATVAASPASGSSAGLSASRSCISFGMSTVKPLNTMPEAAAISSSTTTARRTRCGGMSGKVCAALRDTPSSGGSRSHSTPSTTASAPGSTNAADQPNRTAKNAVSIGARATPTLPHTPLAPIARPGLSAAASTSSAVPTGW